MPREIEAVEIFDVQKVDVFFAQNACDNLGRSLVIFEDVFRAVRHQMETLREARLTGAVVLSQSKEFCRVHLGLQVKLTELVVQNLILLFRVFFLDSQELRLEALEPGSGYRRVTLG